MEYAYERSVMKKHIVTLILSMFIASLTIVGNTIAEDIDDLLIESDITWTEDQDIDGVVRVLSGGKLTIIDSEVTFSSESSLVIDEGGFVILEGATLKSENIPSELVSYRRCDDYNRSTITIDITPYDNNVEILINSSSNTNFNGATAYIGGNMFMMNNSQFSYSPQSTDEELVIGVCGYNSTPIGLSSVTIIHNDISNQYLASELEYSNMMISGVRDYSLDISGNFSLYNSSIIGAKISSTGDISTFSSDFIRSGPILLNDDNASISLTGGSMFKGSLEDHDIRAMPESNIYWGEDTTGSGDLTDKWERRIKGQYLQFDAVWVEYQIKGLYGVDTYTNFSDNDGKSYIDGGRERIIEIGWSDDNIWATNNIWKEDAIINVIKYRTAWNPENSEIGNYGTTGIKLTNEKITIIDQNTPDIKWLSLEPEDMVEEASGKIVMIGEVMNEGTAAAHIAISCYLNSTGESAETDSYPNVLVQAGEVGKIIFDWRNSKSGSEELKCVILTPTQIIEEDSFGGGNITSEAVNWQVNDEVEGLSYVIPTIVGISLGIMIIGYTLVNRANLTQDLDDEED